MPDAKSLLKLEPPALLNTLLDCWRSTRDAALTPLIAALGEKSEGTLGERPDKVKERSNWLVKAFDANETFAAALIEARTFAEMLAASRTLTHFGPVANHWLTMAADPRLASLALWLLQEYPDQTSGQKHVRPCVMPNTVTKALVKVLFLNCDSSHPIDDFIAQRTREVDERTGPLEPYPPSLERELKRVRKVTPSVAFNEIDFAMLQKHIGSPKQQALTRQTNSSVPESELLEAICAAPDDDGPRAIYADWLLEQGRVSLGEFIQLQLKAVKAKLSPAEKTREKALLKEIRPEILKQFGGNTYAIHLPTARFSRGFVVEATLRCNVNVPVFRLIERAIFDDPIVEGARFDRLTLARNVPADSATALLKAAPRLETLQVEHDISNYQKKPAAPLLAFLENETRTLNAIARVGRIDDSQDQVIDAMLASSLTKNARFVSLGVLPNPISQAQLAKIPSAVEVIHFGRIVGASEVTWALGRERDQAFTQLTARFGRFVSDVNKAQPLLAQLAAFGNVSTFSWSFCGENLHDALADGLNPTPSLDAKPPSWAQVNHPLSLFDDGR
jgi:uncharacterized protein (TIGR02996 family)